MLIREVREERVSYCKFDRRHRAGLDGGHTAIAVEASPVGSTSVARGMASRGASGLSPGALRAPSP